MTLADLEPPSMAGPATRETADPLLAVSGLTATFQQSRRDLRILHGVSFTIGEG